MARKAPKKKAASRSNVRAKPAARKSAARKAPRPAAPGAAPQPRWKPPGMHDVIVNLVFKNAAGAIEFYRSAFGATEQMRMMSPDGRGVWHAELRVGDTTVFLNDEMPGGPGLVAAPGPDHKPSATLQLYVADCDATFNRAVQAGARPAMPLTDMFWGDRSGVVIDPFGQPWMISTRVKSMTEEQMRAAGQEFAKQMAQQGGMQPAASKPPPPPSQPPPGAS